jgi:hypothetical protein
VAGRRSERLGASHASRPFATLRNVSAQRFRWSPGDTIPIGRETTLQVVRVRDDDADQAPVLVVEDLA